MIDIVKFAYPNGIGSRGDGSGHPLIPFYSLLIVFGFFLAYFISNYRAKKKGFDWSFFSLPFILAVLAGAIIGARLWYVIASFEEYKGSFEVGFWNGIGAVLNIANGGLAIQGGILLAATTGIIICLFTRKNYSILKITDFIVPTIFIGQFFGRWGNFFNQEVLGHPITPDAWAFLPSFITNNMQNGSSRLLSGVRLPSGSIAAPLFIVEGVLNLMAFVIVALALPRVFKNYKNGDSTFAYFIFYGLIRIILEPVRNAAFIMGNSQAVNLFSTSVKMSLVFTLVGIVLLLSNHLVRQVVDIDALFEKKKEIKNA